MKKNLIIAISATICSYVFYFTAVIMDAVMRDSGFPVIVLFLCLLVCIGACIYTFVLGVQGLKDRNIRGLSIATMAVSGLGSTMATVLAINFIPLIINNLG